MRRPQPHSHFMHHLPITLEVGANEDGKQPQETRGKNEPSFIVSIGFCNPSVCKLSWVIECIVFHSDTSICVSSIVESRVTELDHSDQPRLIK
jgi:hypothetical protein